MKIRVVCCVLLACLLVAVAGCGQASPPAPSSGNQAKEWVFQRPPAEIRLVLTPASPEWHQELRLLLQITLPAAYRPQFPTIDEQLGGLYVATRSQPELVKSDGERYVYAQEYRLETLQAGNNRIPALSFGCLESGKNPAAKATPLTTDEIEFTVRPPATEAPEQLRDIRGATELPERRLWWTWVFVAATLAALVIAFAWRRRQANAAVAESQPTPQQIAGVRLDRLLASPYLRQREYKLFYFEITTIVREYLENAYHLRAPRQTTEEFLLQACHHPQLSAALLTRLREFLQQADLVKYAQGIPGAQEISQVIATAQAVIAENSDGTALSARSDLPAPKQ